MKSPVVSAGEDSSVFPSSVSLLSPDSPDGSEPLGCAGWLGVSASPDDSGVPDGSGLPDDSGLADDSWLPDDSGLPDDYGLPDDSLLPDVPASLDTFIFPDVLSALLP